MSNHLNEKEVLTTYIKNTSENFELLEIIRDKLSENGLYTPSESEMGSSNNGFKEIIINGIVIPQNDEINANITNSITSTLVDINELYSSKQKRLNKIFRVCLISIIISIALVLLGLIWMFIHKENASADYEIGILITANSVLPTFISGIAFLFHKRIDKGAQELEKEIVKLNKLSLFFRMLDSIPDQDSRNKNFKHIITQMGNF